MTEEKFTAAELAERVGGQVFGDGNVQVHGVAQLETAGPGEIAYLEDAKFYSTAETSNAACLIVPVGAAVRSNCRIEVKQPKLAFAQIARLLHPQPVRPPSVDSSARISTGADIDLTVFVGPHVSVGEGARISAGTRIEAGVIIGENVTIGKDCILHPNVVLYDGVSLGDRVVLHAGACIGADGFGYVRDDMGYHKFPQLGTVVIEDDVEIGAHTCVDRAALGRTRIGRGSKLDNLIHVGHNCDIGERVVIAAQTGISGSVTIEDDCVIGGQVGFGDHITVQSGAVIGSKAGVLPGKIVRPGVWWGIPIQPLDKFKRLNAQVNRLPEMQAQLKELTRQVALLELAIKKPQL